MWWVLGGIVLVLVIIILVLGKIWHSVDKLESHWRDDEESWHHKKK